MPLNLKGFEEVVRPERFELPTLWFVAKYSIQLSYGRTHWLQTNHTQIIRVLAAAQCVLSDRWYRFRNGRGRNQRQLLGDLQAGLANELGYCGGAEPGGVEFNAQGAGFAIEAEPPDAVNVPRDGQR